MCLEHAACTAPSQPPQTEYLLLLDGRDQVHLRAPTPAGKRGKAKQHPTRNLLDRLRKQQDAVLAFLSDLAVLFDKELAQEEMADEKADLFKREFKRKLHFIIRP
jgi:hypothetical protein